jgi:osmoprotectant transport system permease protein
VESLGPLAAATRTRGKGGRVNIIIQGFAWIFDGSHWGTSVLQTGIGNALVQHLILSGLSILAVVIIATPLGLYIGHTGNGRAVAILSSNIARALPTVGILALLIIPLTNVIFIQPGYLADLIVLVILGIPPMLAGVYAGLESVDRTTIDAARAIGMTEWQILFKVEVPLGAQLIVGGLRATSLQVISTVTIAALYGQVNLGSLILSGLSSQNYAQMTAGAILVAALALIVDGLLALVQRFVVPRGVSRGTTDARRNTARGRRILTAPSGTPIKEGN